MSSEALGDHPERELARVIPIKQKKIESGEALDFSDMDSETIVSFLFTELRHPGRIQLHGLELAAFLETELSQKPDSDPTSSQARLAQLVSEADMFADDLYDYKYEHDPVFKELIERLQSTKESRDLREQRHAALKLAELRSTIKRDSTDRDETDWLPVIDRLFT